MDDQHHQPTRRSDDDDASEALIAAPDRFDAVRAPEIWARLESALDTAPFRATVDLTRTTFIDSAALAVLVRAMKRARQLGGDLELRAPQTPEAFRIFDLTGLLDVFTIVGPRPATVRAG